MKTHIVKKSECFASIAQKYGFHDAEIIYNDPANSELRSKRDNLHVLVEGDLIYIPEKLNKTRKLAANSAVTFTVKGLLTELHLVIEGTDAKPLCNKLYELEVAGELYSGKTDDNGCIRQKVPASGEVAKLSVYLSDDLKDNLYWRLQMGCLEPVDTLSGVQARLNNLGFNAGIEDGEFGEKTEQAIFAFKQLHNLSGGTEIDQTFTNALKSEYGF